MLELLITFAIILYIYILCMCVIWWIKTMSAIFIIMGVISAVALGTIIYFLIPIGGTIYGI